MERGKVRGMSQSTLTEGDWHVATDRRTRDGDYYIDCRPLEPIAIVSNGESCGRANAQVMAASKDLLKLLKAASYALRSYQYGNAAPDLAEEIANEADAVIARAEGRS